MVIYGKEVNNKNRNAVLIAVLLGWCGGSTKGNML